MHRIALTFGGERWFVAEVNRSVRHAEGTAVVDVLEVGLQPRAKITYLDSGHQVGH